MINQVQGTPAVGARRWRWTPQNLCLSDHFFLSEVPGTPLVTLFPSRFAFVLSQPGSYKPTLLVNHTPNVPELGFINFIAVTRAHL